MRPYRSRIVWTTTVVGLIVIGLSITGAGPAVAQSLRPVMSFIINDANSPVPVREVPSGLTHVGRPASDLVHLVWVGSKLCFVGRIPSGPLDQNCYVPPPGRTLLITDVAWRDGNQLPPGDLHTMALFVLGELATFFGAAVVASNGAAANDHHLQTGFVFHPALRSTVGNVGATFLNGYLVPDE